MLLCEISSYSSVYAIDYYVQACLVRSSFNYGILLGEWGTVDGDRHRDRLN